MRTYEGMFLFDPTAATDWSNVETEVGRLMERASAQLLSCKKWEERRLAYEIKGRNRGCYVLTYFKAAPENLAHIERDVHLSDQVLRCLLLRADHVTEEKMNEPTPAESITRPPEEGRPRSFDGGPPDSPDAKARSAETAPAHAHDDAKKAPAEDEKAPLPEDTAPPPAEKAEAAESN